MGRTRLGFSSLRPRPLSLPGRGLSPPPAGLQDHCTWHGPRLRPRLGGRRCLSCSAFRVPKALSINNPWGFYEAWMMRIRKGDD